MKSMNDLTTEEKRSIIHANGGDKEHLLAILHELQNASGYNYIDKDTAALVAEEVGLAPARVYEIITFYAMLKSEPKAQFVLKVCNSSPCHFSHSREIAGMLEEELGVKMGETTADGVFAFHYIPCVGACDIGPVIKVKDTVYGNLNRDKIRCLLADLKSGKRSQ